MHAKELKARIKELEERLQSKEGEYTDAIKSHRDYNSLRNIRDNIKGLKKELEQLYQDKKS